MEVRVDEFLYEYIVTVEFMEFMRHQNQCHMRVRSLQYDDANSIGISVTKIVNFRLLIRFLKLQQEEVHTLAAHDRYKQAQDEKMRVIV